MDIAVEHLDLLRLVGELEDEQHAPGTIELGQRLLEVWRERGGFHTWRAAVPWQGTSPFAPELVKAGLLERHVGIARFHRRDEPAEVVQQYWLTLTELGRALLVEADAVLPVSDK